ncbi:hypothetical protein [Nocardioides soli]|uniref:Uncharacterized protein n=1 Tax=Nocardioides soli TaxID=1036020 RepID=A0A7W4VTD3_9ACTN|nr:hypothetical protein [Nocardioides soli]MBB3041024.1 hypothetical protein [Nocardioides soli]
MSGQSILAGLRKAREKALAELTIDLQVPGLDDPKVYVRYRPIQQREVDLVHERTRDTKSEDRDLIANASLLAHACVGVFVTVDGKPDGDPSTWPRFDQDLAQMLGIDEAPDGSKIEPTTAEIVRALYMTDGALLNTARALDAWSAPAILRREEEHAGN